MLLVKLELSNFRSYYGKTVIEFARAIGKSVTIFHGENGAGKTNLLNAIHWCISGVFTPRFKDPHLLINKTAKKEGVADCYAELHFVDDGKEYRARRTYSQSRSQFELWSVQGGNSKLISNGERAVAKFMPKSLVQWFFFDAEAIGSMELSGSEEFKRDLRKTLGFELVDTLVDDLEWARNKRQREVSVQVNDKELASYQAAIDEINLVLPGQEAALASLNHSVSTTRKRIGEVQAELKGLPESKKLEARRKTLEGQLASFTAQKLGFEKRAAQICGEAAPSIFLQTLSEKFEETLESQEVQGRLPSPYSDQLVKEILEAKNCICGREVIPDSVEAEKIRGLLRFAGTSALNQRIKEVQLVLREIDKSASTFAHRLGDIRQQIKSSDQEINNIQIELIEIHTELMASDHKTIAKLEKERDELLGKLEELSGEQGVMRNTIMRNKEKIQDYQLRYEKASSKVKVGAKLKGELNKVVRLREYVIKTLEDHEKSALSILTIELNLILEKYLAKHFSAKIDASTYAVKLIDADGQGVGPSTGEGQVLKFAFISTVVALAAKKTKEKIDFMTEPTEAPLVLDAPLSALDPVYQGSVAKNLAAQTSQLVLMLSSAGWSESVSSALKQFIGNEYVLVSNAAGSRNDKPLKTMDIWGQSYQLNNYDSVRDETTIERVRQ